MASTVNSTDTRTSRLSSSGLSYRVSCSAFCLIARSRSSRVLQASRRLFCAIALSVMCGTVL